MKAVGQVKANAKLTICQTHFGSTALFYHHPPPPPTKLFSAFLYSTTRLLYHSSTGHWPCDSLHTSRPSGQGRKGCSLGTLLAPLKPTKPQPQFSVNNNNNNLFYTEPQQQLYELLVLYKSTNVIEVNTHQYVN